MKNPLNKRILRELKSDFTKYIVIFAFMVMLISLVSGFLVADKSVLTAYRNGFEKFKVEDGHITFDKEPSKELLTKLEKKGELSFYPLYYFEEQPRDSKANIRVYKLRNQVNLEDVMSGRLPEKENEIAIDRMFAENNSLQVGDELVLKGKALTITGLVALPDYSCLFENNSDMIFDSINFAVAVMEEKAWEAMESGNVFYNYSWKYQEQPKTDKEKDKKSEEFLHVLEDVIKAEIEKGQIIQIKDYVPEYQNQAITYTGEDMGKDRVMFLVFDYIVICILAFIFAVTTTNTIAQEAGVIGTLRASGYSKGELIRHYMVLPVLVTFLAAIVGNILGYTVLEKVMVGAYYNSYSLCSYKTLFSAEAFLDTTVIPIILMFVINLTVLIRKMKYTPLQFLRREISRRARKKALRLNTRIPIMHRFRLRILLQNLSSYVVLMVGIFCGGVIIVFGTMFGPLLEDYEEMVVKSKLCEYQYILKEEVETKNEEAEKFAMKSLDSVYEEYMTDTVSVMGIEEHSRYIQKDIPQKQVLVSNAYADKFGTQIGDTIRLKEKYTDQEYSFKVGGIYMYDAGMYVFMNRSDYNRSFDEKSTAFTGYFSNEKLTDISEDQVYTMITEQDLTKISEQLKVSMGSFMTLFRVFGAIMFVMMMYILTKQIIEKNMNAISLTKILGFTEGEIAGLYLVMTSIVVLAGLFLTIPLVDRLLHVIFQKYMYKMMTGYIPYIVSNNCYILLVTVGIACYGLVSFIMMFKIKSISKSEALKNVE